MRKLLALALLLLPTAAFGQAGVMLGAGQVFGNSTASRAPAKAETVTAILDRALGSTRGSVLERGASGWGIIAPSATAGLPFVSGGTGADPLYQVLGVAGGGTGLTSYVIGDLIYASGATTLSKLADIAVGNALLSGGVGAAPSWGKITSSHLNITTTTCTNQFVTAISATGTGTCSSATLASAQFANQGTTTTVLHGNAAGNPSFGAVAYADISSTDIASSSQYLAGTASKLVQSGAIYQAEVSLGSSGSGTFVIDFSTFINAAVTMTGNITTQTLNNVTAGKAGTITFIQDGTGSRTTVWNTIFKFAGGSIPALSTGANSVDVLSYSCRSATFCLANLSKDVRNP